MDKKYLQNLTPLIFSMSILFYDYPAKTFNTVNTSDYDIFVWHNAFIWQDTQYKEIVPAHTTSKGWYYTGKDNIPLSVGICNYGGDPVENTCNNDYWYGYPQNNHYSTCTVTPHGQQIVTINNPNDVPIVSCN